MGFSQDICVITTNPASREAGQIQVNIIYGFVLYVSQERTNTKPNHQTCLSCLMSTTRKQKLLLRFFRGSNRGKAGISIRGKLLLCGKNFRHTHWNIELSSQNFETISMNIFLSGLVVSKKKYQEILIIWANLVEWRTLTDQTQAYYFWEKKIPSQGLYKSSGLRLDQKYFGPAACNTSARVYAPSFPVLHNMWVGLQYNKKAPQDPWIVASETFDEYQKNEHLAWQR